ncbi:MAG: hypothetical protein WD749_10605 [Phycisphaerales bacterium]
MRHDLPILAFTGAAGLALAPAWAQPIIQTWPVQGPDDTVAVASPALSGWYAAADSFEDSVEVRDISGALVRTITRAEIAALLPWMSLGGGPDGPSGLAWSDSGRLLFILVHDANPAGGGQPSDGVLRYDTGTDSLGLFARLELFDRDDQWPHLAGVHFKARLYVGAFGFGGPGIVHVFQATANNGTGALLGIASLPSGTSVHGLAIDRANGFLYAASESSLFRANLAAWPLSFTLVGNLANPRGLAYSDHYGGAANAGLYALAGTSSPPAGQVSFIPPAQALGTQGFAPTLYASSASEWHSITATADGKLLVGMDEDAALISDASDPRLSFSAWISDEFAQAVQLARGLISPDGEPAGWVIDADVQQGWTRFHPATPDAAGWAILLLMMNEQINGDPLAQARVRQVLVRYAGQAPDGIRPGLTADGVMRHWIDPFTGQAKAGWDPEFATLSTEGIVLAASRARARYPSDSVIQQAAAQIICQVRNHDAYFQAGSDAVYLKGLVGGGPATSSASRPFSEAILLAEQLGFYGTAGAGAAYARWLDRSRWPSATYLSGRPITGDVAGQFQAAFTSLYPLLLLPAFRASPGWQDQVATVRDSNAGWTDDNGPRFATVFSAGTTKAEWGGYHADTLADHPGEVTSFPALMALSATGRRAEAVGAYNAYRRGARQTFLSGASILYRRSNADPAYQPNSAGLPDVALGALGLAELIQPGSVSQVLAMPYQPCTPPPPPCYANCDASTTTPLLNVADFGCFLQKFAAGDAYANCDGSTTPPPLNVADFSCFLTRFAAGCP